MKRKQTQAERNRRTDEGKRAWMTCTICRGSGYLHDDTGRGWYQARQCSTCQGTGHIATEAKRPRYSITADELHDLVVHELQLFWDHDGLPPFDFKSESEKHGFDQAINLAIAIARLHGAGEYNK